MRPFDELENWQEKHGFTLSDDELPIYFTPTAAEKIVSLVLAHSLEIGWDMTVKPYKNGYKIYDVFVYPQKVAGASIDVDLHGDYKDWKNELEEEVEQNLFGQGHSHVNMEPFASIVDINHQYEQILFKRKGFYLFQIWNKQMHVSSYFYDVSNRVYYDPDHVVLLIDFEDDDENSGDMTQFIDNSFTMLKGYDYESE